MISLLDKVTFISTQLDKDILIYKNPFDNKVEVFLFYEINNKTTNTPYHEFKGYLITREVETLNENSFYPDSFLRNAQNKPLIMIRTAEVEYIWFKATKN